MYNTHKYMVKYINIALEVIVQKICFSFHITAKTYSLKILWNFKFTRTPKRENKIYTLQERFHILLDCNYWYNNSQRIMFASKIYEIYLIFCIDQTND